MEKLDIIEKEVGENPKYLILWLHGLGADATDFLPLVESFSFCRTYPAIFVFPNAPVRSVTINQGSSMRAWYDITQIDIKASANLRHIQDSFLALEQILTEYVQKGIPEKNILVAGFSQGGVMACELGLKSKYEIRAVVGLSCYLTQRWEKIFPTKKTPPAFFLGHGTEDPIVSFVLGEQARDSLLEKGIETTWKKYSGMSHGVCEQEIVDVEKFIVKQFKRNGF